MTATDTTASTLMVAIDISKHRHEVLIGVPGKKRRRRLTITNAQDDFQRLATALSSYDLPVRIGFEATGNYHRPLAHHLGQAGFDLKLVSSVGLARTREALHNSWDKNDPKDALPKRWRDVLGGLRAGITPNGTVPPADSVIDNMEDVLREHIHVQKAAGLPEDITVEGIRRLEASKTAHAAARKDPKYTDQGNRPATRHTVVMRLRLFAEYLGVDPLVLSALKAHENELRRALGTVVPLKFGKLYNLLGLMEVWDLAQDLLKQSLVTNRRATRLRLLNEVVVIALWTLLPLRLRDGQLVWGRDIAFDAARYRIDIVTEKESEPLRGRLHSALTPFLDALVLKGMDPTYLEQMRDRALLLELPLFVTTKGRQLAKTYPSSVWRKHFGTGAHIARSRVHTELGQLGPEGVAMALALNAQRSVRTAEAYQAAEVDLAMHASCQDMIDVILAECLG